MSQPGSSKDANMQWMYEGAKSLVNREDYLLGKRIDKNFELYSDVVVKDEEDEKKSELFKRGTLQHPGHDQKISALDTRVVRNEDPLVALKFQEEQRKRQMLENPLLKLKAQRVLKKALEKELRKEMEKSAKKHKHSKKHRHKSNEESSSSEGEPEKKRNDRRSGSRERREEKRRRRTSTRSASRERRRSRSRSRSRHHHRRESTSSSGRKREDHRQHRESHRREEREHPKREEHRERKESKTLPDAKEAREPPRASRPKLTPEELEERRKAMMANASWRDEMREQNVKAAAEQLRKEEAEASNAPTFMKPLLSSATANSSLEQRLQSNKMNIQRNHDHMDKSFARK